ncbi:MAG: nucleotidyltransferase domain-containing protein [Parcubacteria group bacterium]|nr:nucleotidyltransferase domain-containing protein [Parcubacteria group bacterium]
MITREKIKEVADKIAREFQPEKIILFGSFAWGTPTEDSDIDLFIVKETENTRGFAREVDRSFSARDFSMDIIVYTPEQVEKRKKINDLFIREIFTNGKFLYG